MLIYRGISSPVCGHVCVHMHTFENIQIMRTPPIWLVENVSHTHSSYVLWNLFS